MSVSYVTAGSSPTAAQLNKLTAELDAILRCLYGEKSFLVYPSGGSIPANLQGAEFYFGNDADWLMIPLLRPVAAPYDHSVFVAAAAAMVVSTYNATLKLANVVTDAVWPLDGSLEAHKIEHGGGTYWFNRKTTGGKQKERERYLKLNIAEVWLEALPGNALTWNVTWDKYHFLRFHNLDIVPVTVTLPGPVAITIPPLGIKAVRRQYPHANTWSQAYVYLWQAISGDSLCWDSVSPNNVASMACFHRWIDLITTIYTRRAHIKPSVLWNGAALLQTAIDPDQPLYKYKYRLGRIVSWSAASTATPVPVAFSPTWTELEAGTNGIKLNVAAWQIQEDGTLGTSIEACGLGATILPIWPTALPYTLPTFATGLSAPGATASPHTVLANWYVEEDPLNPDNPFIVPASEDVTYNLPACSGSHWTAVGGVTDTLADLIALEAGAGELTTAPTVNLASDGWRLVASGTVEIPPELGALPDSLAGCDISEDGVIQYFGIDLLRRQEDQAEERGFAIFSGAHGRQVSDYLGYTSGGSVIHEGHPDVSGTYGLAGGIDYTENRTSPGTAEILREESFGGLGSGTLYYVQPTLNLPVLLSLDAGERVAANYTDPDWYVANRADLLAHVQTVEDMQKVMRAPILAMHYDHIAGRLNSICWIEPMILVDVTWYGDLDDRIWSDPSYPVDWYCGVLETGSRAEELGLVVTGTGTESHLTLTTAAAWAATLGLRFFERRISQILDADGLYTRDPTGTRRTPLGPLAHVMGFVEWPNNTELPDELTLHPHTVAGSPTPTVCLAEIEFMQELGPVFPTGWDLAADDMFMTASLPTVAFVNDPVVGNNGVSEEKMAFIAANNPGMDIQFFNQPFEDVPAQAVDPKLWSLADAPGVIDSQAIADLYELGTIDPRSAWKFQLANRWMVIRA